MMYQERRTADVPSLPGFTFTRIDTLTFGEGIIRTHYWVHQPSGIDAGGFNTKREAVESARTYRRDLRAETTKG